MMNQPRQANRITTARVPPTAIPAVAPVLSLAEALVALTEAAAEMDDVDKAEDEATATDVCAP